MYNNNAKVYKLCVTIMIDTIHFLVKDFEVEEKANLIINSGIDCQRILYYPVAREKCMPVTGQGAFYNSRKVSATIFNMRYQSKPMMKLRVSAPKCLRADNFQLVEGQDLPEVYHLITEELRGAGIHFNIMESILKRLELARNFKTLTAPRNYIETLRGLDVPRMEKEVWETALLYTNGQQEINFYDKIEEMKEKGLDTSAYPLNVLRCEQRLKTGPKIEISLGITSGEDLIDLYSRCAPWYEENLKKYIFKLNPDTTFIQCSLKAEMESFKKIRGPKLV